MKKYNTTCKTKRQNWYTYKEKRIQNNIFVILRYFKNKLEKKNRITDSKIKTIMIPLRMIKKSGI